MTFPKIILVTIFSVVLATGMFLAINQTAFISNAEAAKSGKDKPLVSPTEARERNFYAPNSENLAPDEQAST